MSFVILSDSEGSDGDSHHPEGTPEGPL